MTKLPLSLSKNLKNKALYLRRKGYSIKEIANKLKIAPSTISVWVRGIPLNRKAQLRLFQKRKLLYYKISGEWMYKRQKQQNELKKIAKEIIRKINLTPELKKLICSIIYWCEGNKSDKEPLRFINSDPDLVKLFLFLLKEGFGINEKKIKVRMHLHSYHDERKQKKFWSRIVGISSKQFYKTFIKESNHKRLKPNYQGCITISYYDIKLSRLIRMLPRLFIKERGIG